MAGVQRYFSAVLGTLALTASCGDRVLSLNGGANRDAGGDIVGGDALPEPAQPPAASAGLKPHSCGAMVKAPDLLGVDADGEVVLLAVGFDYPTPALLHLFSRVTGRVVRTINLDSDAALLTADRLHILTGTSLVDLRTGFVVQRPPLGSNTASYVFAVGPSGDFEIAAQETSATTASVVLRHMADNSEQTLVPSTGGRVFAAAVTDDGLRLLLLVAKAPSVQTPVAIEVRRLADGSLESEIPVSDSVSVGLPAGATEQLVSQPQLTASGDYVLANLAMIGYRGFRISDGTLVWAPDPSVKQAQLSPQPGIVAFRAASGEAWQELEMTTGRVVGSFASGDGPQYRGYGSLILPPLLSFVPDGSEVVLSGLGGLRVGHADTSTTALPFNEGGWSGRSAFVSAREVVSIEEADGVALFTAGVRKRSIPGGEILAEMSSGEAQSEWVGDIALSPDGQTLAIAFPDRVHLLRSTDLHETGVIARAAGRVAWSSDGSMLLTTPDLHYRDGGRPTSDPPAAVDVWTGDGHLRQTLNLPFVPFFATFTADGLGIVATGQPHEDHFDQPVNTQPPGPVSRVAFSGAPQSVKIDRATGAMLALSSASFAVDDGRHFFTDLHSVLRVSNGESVAALDAPGFSAIGLYQDGPAFSPDGALVAGMNAGNNTAPAIFLYEAASGRTVTSIPNKSGVIGTLAFSPDGRQLAVQSPGTWSGLDLICLGP